MKTMNSKMTTKSKLSITKPKKKKNQNTKMNQANNQNRNRFIEIQITWRVISGEGKKEEWGKRYREKEA